MRLISVAKIAPCIKVFAVGLLVIAMVSALSPGAEDAREANSPGPQDSPGATDADFQSLDGFANPIILISTNSVESLLEDKGIRIIDAREAHLYRQGHIPGALTVPVDRIIDFHSRFKGAMIPDNRLALRFGVMGIGPNTHVVVYDHQGGRQASRLVWALHYMGHPLVSVMHGGFNKWQAEKRPITQEFVAVPRTTFPVDTVPRRLATAGWIYEHLDDPNVMIVDVRVEEAYSQDHIPGAINLPWKQFMNDDYTSWKSAEQLMGILERAGVTKDKELVVYSDVGQIAALPYVILRALGYVRVRNYDRSWAEWGNDFSLPKVGKTSPDLPLLKAIFRANGCANCHGISAQPQLKGVNFRDAGIAAADLDQGCVKLLGKIKKLAELIEEQREQVQQNFVDHGCAKCHDVQGAGTSKANLTNVGEQFQKMNLGCIDMMFVLSGLKPPDGK